MKEFNESYGHTDNLKLCGFCYFVLFYFHYYPIENWENEQGFCCINVDYDPMILSREYQRVTWIVLHEMCIFLR